MLDKVINELHLYEKKLLKEIADDSDQTPEEIAEKADIPVKAVTSAAGMLSSKDIITVDKNVKETIGLSDEGKDYALNGLPEHRILKALQEFSNEGILEVPINDVMEKAGISKHQMNFSIGVLMRRKWAKMNKGKLSLTEEGKNVNIEELPEYKFLKGIFKRKGLSVF